MDHNNPYFLYYQNQAGFGMPVFEGMQYQRGHGWFGDALNTIYSKVIRPGGEYLLNKVWDTTKKIGSDVMNGKNALDSLKSNLIGAAEDTIQDGAQRIKKFIQTGQGVRRRRRRRGKRSKQRIGKILQKVKKRGTRKRKTVKKKPPQRKGVKKTSKRRRSRKRSRSKRKSQKNKFLNLFK